MPYTALQQLDLIKANKIKLINKINTLLRKDSGLTWDSPWADILTVIQSIKTLLPEENQEIINEIEKFLANNSIGEVTINSDEIIPFAFYQKNTITSLIGPNVKTVETSAFYNDSQLISINLPEVETIKTGAFYNTRISELSLPNATLIEDQSFWYDTALTSITLPKLTKINSYTFRDCTALSSVTIPNLNYISSYGFYNTQIKLKDISINNITYLGTYALANCKKLNEDLDSIEILPQNNLIIESYCFRDSNLSKDVFIGNKVTNVGQYAFRDCGTDTKFWCEAPSKPSEWSTNWNYSHYPVNWGCVEKEYTFVKNNGEDNLVITKRTITNEDFPIIEKEGYQLDSWYLDENFTKEISTPYYSKVNSTESTTIYARWTRGFKIIAINIEDNYSETDFGTCYFNNISDFKDHLGMLNCVGYYKNYANQIFENVIADLDVVEGLLPTIYVKATNATVITEVKDFNYTGSVAETTLLPGQHTLECWGAQGGNNSNNSKEGGRGGYSAGVLTLAENTLINVLVGGRGNNGYSGSHLVLGGFNGGGTGYTNNSGACGGGGGATDIRLFQNSLYSRVIVAGGGGGAAGDSYTSNSYLGYQYGYGGGETAAGYTNYSITNGQASGASITGPGNAPYANGNSTKLGTFGLGGTWTSYSSSYNAAGGGGGWYGGNSGIHDGYAGGGSGFVYTEDNAQYYPDGCLLNSTHYLAKTSIMAGNTEFLGPDGTTERGHAGNGYVRITSVIKGAQESTFKGCTLNIKGIIRHEIVALDTITLMHNIQKSTLETTFGIYVNESKEWYYDEECQKPLNSILEIPTDNTEINIYCNVIEVIEYNFEYTGAVQTITLSPANYKLECWGAEGGHTNTTYGTNYIEGHGGYASGLLAITESTNLFINVGGAGAASGTSTVALGGFNGGGNGYSSARATTSGGGGSDIRIGTDSLYARVLVAGGGGGGRDAGNQGNTQVLGRSCGGGTIGLQGGYYNSSSITSSTNRNGRGGGGGGYNQAGDTGSIENGETLYSAQFGLGGYCANSSTYGEGGGGGWYGGGAGSADADGGGGSCYAYTADTAQYYPTGCLLTQKYYLTNTTISAGNQEFLAPNNTLEVGHQGNGYIRITKVS